MSEAEFSNDSNQISETSEDVNQNSCIDLKKKFDSSDSSHGNNSRDLKTSHQQKKIQIVPSRYKQAALEKYKSNKSNKSSDGSGSGGNLSSPSLSSSSDHRWNARFHNRSVMLTKKKGLSASIGNLTQSKFSLPNKLKVNQNGKKYSNSNYTKQGEVNLRKSSIDSELSNPKLHSTALHNNTFFDRTQLSSADIFSTTVVGGQNLHPISETPGRERCLSVGLSDISEIRPMSSSKNCHEGEITVISHPCEKEEGKLVDKEDYTPEELNAEYLRYLTWALIDVNSSEAHKRQIDEAQKQLLFLSSLVEEQEKGLLEDKKLLELIECHENISTKHEMLHNRLSECVATVPECVNALNVLSHHLEVQSNQVKLENVYIPENEVSYKEELNEVLKENYDLLKQLNICLGSKKEKLNSLSVLFTNLNEVIEVAKPCISEVERTAGNAIQESSLKLTIESHH